LTDAGVDLTGYVLVIASDVSDDGCVIVGQASGPLGIEAYRADVCIDSIIIGGNLLPVDTTALLLAGSQSFSWMIPVVLSVLGIGLFVFRKSE